MDYSTLVASESTQGSIKYWINWSRIDSAEILTEAQAWIYSRIRNREMRATADITIADAVATSSLPTGFLDPIHFSIPGYASRIKLKDIEWFRTHLGWDESAVLPEGVPTYYAIFNELIQLNTLPDAAYTGKMLFYKKPDALAVTTNETNWLTTRYPTLLRRVCTMFAAEARKEYETMDRNAGLAMAEIQQINIESDLSNRGLELDFHWQENA